jgi:hypothetical protein
MSVLPLLGLRTIVCITSAITRDFMLAAAANGKLKRRRDYLEDEITSIFFGGLQLLPIKTIWSLFAKIAKQANIHSDAFSSSPTSANFEYWPRFDNIEPDLVNVEPDLVINFKQDGRPLLNIIVEVKWNSPLNPKCELVKQWSSRLHWSGCALDRVPIEQGTEQVTAAVSYKKVPHQSNYNQYSLPLITQGN